MFAGGRRRSSNNVRAMQLFHELKQQFPTIPDHVVTACIANNDQRPADHIVREVLEAAATLQHELMGRNPSDRSLSPEPKDVNSISSNEKVDRSLGIVQQLNASNDQLIRHALNKPSNSQPERLRSEMNQGESDLNRNIIKKPESTQPKRPLPKRPDTLALKGEDAACRIQQSEKCKNVFKLLNSSKPPKSPGTPKRPPAKQSPRSSLVKTSDLSDTSEIIQKTETTQTTNTLADPPNLNLSLNVNYSMGLPPPKHTTALQVVPQQPWIPELSSPRSFTSVNLTLRPPSSEPQPPIDITSRNSSLTYSTSTFDSQKGLQSKLQITVSPTGGCVSSVRTRPRSYHSGDGMEPSQPQRTGSTQDLSASPILLKQQARIEKLKIELKSEKVRLVALQSEVARLAASQSDALSDRTDAELEKQLQREIRHLRGQCERLTVEVDRQTANGVPLGETSEEFYRNIYTGQRGPLNFRLFEQSRSSRAQDLPQSENFGSKWSCSLCTFQNHPLLDKCEQCEMARIVHGTVNPLVKSQPYLRNLQSSLNTSHAVTAANTLLQHVTNNLPPEYLRRHSSRFEPPAGDSLPPPAKLNNTR